MINKLLTFEEIVTNKTFVIPDYQRGYSWEVEQIQDLLDDIHHISKREHMHYTGTLVICDNGNGAFDIVDGQQRMTTLVMFMNQVIKFNRAKYCHHEDVFIRRENGDYVLTMNVETNRYFKEAILKDRKNIPVDTKPLQNLRNARVFLERWVKDNADDLDLYIDTVMNKLGFICFAPVNTSEIGIMFEVINNRGKELSELEKIKNFFIYYSTVFKNNNLRNKVNETWADILKNLNLSGISTNDEENRFLRNCYLVFYSYNKQKSWYVYDELKKRYDVNSHKEAGNNISEIERFIDFLYEASQSYASLFNWPCLGSELSHDQLKKIQSRLKRLKCHPVNASILPLYLASMAYVNERPDDVCRLLDLIEILNFRIYVLPNTKIARADTHQGELFSWAHELYNDRYWNVDEDEGEYFTVKGRRIQGDIINYIMMNLEDFVLEYCPEEVFVQSLTIDKDESIDYYSWNGLRFFLASYEEHLNRERKETWDIESILKTREDTKETGNDYLSREHIWARKNLWENFPENYLDKRRLGNFVLLGLSSNIQLQDNNIDLKVKDLEESSSISMLQVNKLSGYLEIAIAESNKNWKNKVANYYKEIAVRLIDQRETDLISFGLTRWALPGEVMDRFEKIDSFQAEADGKNHSYFFRVRDNEML